MAPKQPQTLLALATSRAGHIACCALSEVQKLRNADETWQPTVQACQDYYRTFISPTMWPFVCSLENILQQFSVMVSLPSPHYLESSCNFTSEILLSFVVHDDVLKLVLQPSVYRCLPLGIATSVQDMTSMLSRLTRIVELNLGEVHVTDELLLALGTNCKQLEKLKFSSEPQQTAVGLSYTVTDKGLLNLVLCKQLRYLKDECRFVWAKLLTVKYVLKQLPKLMYFNSMVMMLLLRELAQEENVAPLKLTTLRLCVKHPPNIAELARLCPDVRKLELHFCYSDDELLFTRSMISLAENPLVCPTIKLKWFNLCENTFISFQRYLSVKGSEIRKLSLCFQESVLCIDRKLLVAIGETCPHIRELEIVTESHDHVLYRQAEVSGQPLAVATKPGAPSMFLHLNRLRLNGHQVVDHGDLLTVFADARELVDISVCIMSQVHSLLSVENSKFGEMFAAGVFAELRWLEIKSWYTKMLKDHVSVIVDNSPNLSFLSLMIDWNSQYNEMEIYIDELVANVKQNNLDLHIFADCLLYFD